MNYNFYHIYPLGLTGAPERNDLHSEPVSRIRELESWIDHIKEGGFNAVYFGPLFESESHGYDTVDYYRIDRRLGTNEDFAYLCGKLKENGLAVFVDGVFNHVARSFRAFRDLEEKRGDSSFRDWFKDVSIDPFHVRCWEGHESLVELNLTNSSVREHIFGAVEMWFRQFGIDGLRLDVAYCLHMDFLQDLRNFTRGLDRDFQLLGEVIHGDYRQWLDRDLLDSVTNYECYKGIYSSLNDNNFYEIAYSLNRLFGEDGIYRNYSLYNFIDNHDVNRIASVLKHPGHFYNALIALYTIPGNPSVYYGSEWGLEGIKEGHSDRNLRPALRCQDHPSEEREIAAWEAVRKLASIRNASPSLRKGSYRELYKDSNQMAFAREEGDELTVCALNSSQNEVRISIPVPRDGAYRDLLNDETLWAEKGVLHLRIWPNWGAVLRFSNS
ncbi:alpha-amylase family glycosyl hydrolase [Spirochaeta isovalerica]|uniref:Glycosidase n=1 Tax=Spirochaeta isovalerica TaxID=150 RepID=A0A841RBX8_9SPIO|nr:alpha-amylase family glycosyl hydrolase [Spirochaeta isovalerica]MBB6481443.1 glycosidase [Spirochaeta isovalerica]